MELNGSTVEKAYIYANGQIIAQHDGAPATNNKYFYLHDRLGSVRQIINYADSQVNVKNRYTYKPFGELFEKPGEDETEETVTNSFKFTGQYYDDEIGQYYLRVRQYDLYLTRFTARDPVAGRFEEPLSLHKYLYCRNDPINRMDPSGEFAVTRGVVLSANQGVYGGAVALQFFYGMSDDLNFFCGYMFTVASGPNPSDMLGPNASSLGLSGSGTIAIGYSPDAQSPADLAGPMFEVGGSYGAGLAGGGELAWSLPGGVHLRTAYIGVGAGKEFHGHGSFTLVFGDWMLGPTATRESACPASNG